MTVTELWPLLLSVFTKSSNEHCNAGKDNMYHDVNNIPIKNFRQKVCQYFFTVLQLKGIFL